MGPSFCKSDRDAEARGLVLVHNWAWLQKFDELEGGHCGNGASDGARTRDLRRDRPAL